ncbi:MAG: DUF411 domain-containing protein [Methylococcaceae bacterium]|nr:DUF411 domain-containing protein [Methylococcaceae bacterium]
MVYYRLTLSALLWAYSFNGGAESIWDKSPPFSSEPVAITVYRSPSCGCCGIWLEHIRKHNFMVTDIKTEDVNSIKQKYAVSPQLASCHTALVDGYVIEGHVPAADIRKLLAEKPKVIGLAVPGMPQGTPGMEMNGGKEPFSVISFDKDGKQRNFTDYLFY